MQNKFFGSKLNTVLLLFFIILLGFTIYFLRINIAVAPEVTENNQESNIKNEIKKDFVDSNLKEYKNDKLGISFQYPAKYGEIKVTTHKGEQGEIIEGGFGSFYFNAGSVDFTEGSERTAWGGSGEKDLYMYTKDLLPSFPPNNNSSSIAWFITNSGEKGIEVQADGECGLGDVFCQGFRGYVFNLKGKIFTGILFSFDSMDKKDKEALMKSLKIY